MGHEPRDTRHEKKNVARETWPVERKYEFTH